MRLRALAILWCLIPIGSLAAAQTAPVGQGSRLRVFLDCESCFPDYLREEIKWVDFVRQREDADVHLLSSSRETGGGGREVVLRFVGGGRFSGVDQELRAVSLTADTEDTRRQGVLRAVSVGLLAYAAREGLPADLSVRVRSEVPGGPGAAKRDFWNFWVFSLRGGGEFDAEESERQWNWELSASADRVTDNWIISFGANANTETQQFDLDEEEPLTATRREREFDGFIAKSLGEHWSAGFECSLDASTYDNTQFAVALAPTVEFNVFPYAEYASRQLRFQYSIGPVHARYNEVTVFGKLRETVGRHEASMTLEQRQPWGTLEAGVEWSQFLHDLSKYRLEVQGDVSLRLARGLSLNLDGSISRVRDQLNIPLRDATPEEVLLRLRELRSGYEVRFDISLTYSFGSIFNNIVNPRFGR